MNTTTATKINFRSISLYANGIITLDQALANVDAAIRGLIIGKGFGESMESFIARDEKARIKFETYVNAKNFFLSNPTREQAKEINGYNS